MLSDKVWKIAVEIFETRAYNSQGLMLKVGVIDQLEIADDMDAMVSGDPISSLVEDVRLISGTNRAYANGAA